MTIDWTHPFLLALAASLPPLVGILFVYILGLRTSKQIKHLRVEVNGRLHDLLQTTKTLAFSRGEKKGTENERDRISPKQE